MNSIFHSFYICLPTTDRFFSPIRIFADRPFKLVGLLISFLIITVGAIALYPTETYAVAYPPISGDNTHEWIRNVKFNTIDNSSEQNNKGYGNYTYDASGIFTRVEPGSTHTLSITIQPDTTWCDEYVYAYFDWNHNGYFSGASEVVKIASKTCATGPISVNVTVPRNASSGETRMRIVVRYFNPPPSMGNIPEGEAEDYSIIVGYPKLIGKNTSEWITKVQLGSYSNTTAQEIDGYGDYSLWNGGPATEIQEGNSNFLSVIISPDPVFCDESGYAENVSAFFDWNQDGDFVDPGEAIKVAVSTCSTGPHTVNVFIPPYALPGRTLMRIVLHWGYLPPSSGYVFGEGEDYTVFVKTKFPWSMILPAIFNNK